MSGDWISAREIRILVSNWPQSFDEVARAICKRASTGRIKTKAASFVYENDLETRERQECRLPSFFWPREHFDKFEQNWKQGDFSTLGGKIRCHAFDVSFARSEIEAMAPSDSVVLHQHAAPARTIVDRPPSDEAICAKADEMRARGLNGREIAARMRMEPGFENAGTVIVRSAILGRYKAGRPAKPLR